MKALLLSLLLFFPLFAQPQPALPSRWVSLGAQYDRGTAGVLTYGSEIGSSKIYSETTVVMTLKSMSTRTGVAYPIVQYGNLVLLALGQGGIVTGQADGSTTTLGSLSGGFVLAYKFKRFYVGVVAAETSVAGQSVKPRYELQVGWAF